MTFQTFFLQYFLLWMQIKSLVKASNLNSFSLMIKTDQSFLQFRANYLSEIKKQMTNFLDIFTFVTLASTI